MSKLFGNKKLKDKFDFCKLRQFMHYVDKTLLIKEIINLNSDHYHIIFSPRRWGKSTNIFMLYYLFAIYQKNPSPIINIEDNSYKVLFDNTQIANHSEIFEKHFEKHLVVNKSLSCVIPDNFVYYKN